MQQQQSSKDMASVYGDDGVYDDEIEELNVDDVDDAEIDVTPFVWGKGSSKYMYM